MHPVGWRLRVGWAGSPCLQAPRTPGPVHRLRAAGSEVGRVGRWARAGSPRDPRFAGRFFIGTSVSTFSFRIHEEREILGLDPRTTYNRFCGDREEVCEQPTHWRVAY